MLKFASQFTRVTHWGKGVTAAAAGSGNLELLQWLRANGCAWGDTTCATAAQHGHLHILKWARVNGCEWSWQTCAAAAEARDAEMGARQRLRMGTYV